MKISLPAKAGWEKNIPKHTQKHTLVCIVCVCLFLGVWTVVTHFSPCQLINQSGILMVILNYSLHYPKYIVMQSFRSPWDFHFHDIFSTLLFCIIIIIQITIVIIMVVVRLWLITLSSMLLFACAGGGREQSRRFRTVLSWGRTNTWNCCQLSAIPITELPQGINVY